MKYEKELYIESQIFSGDMDGSESNFSEKIVKPSHTDKMELRQVQELGEYFD